MSYTKTNWTNGQAPAINDTNLNKIEQGIFDNDNSITNLLQALGIDTTTWVNTDSYEIGDVVVYQRKLYKNKTGNNTTTNPATDTTNWEEIPIIVDGKINNSLLKIKDVLYNNTSGTEGNVTLNDSINNYSYIEIYYGKGAGSLTSSKYSVDLLRNVGTNVTLYALNAYNNTSIQELYKNITISGTSITSNYGFARNSDTSNTGNITVENQVKIYKVLGYK